MGISLPLGNLPEIEAEEKAERGLRSYLFMIRKHLWLIIGLTVLCTALTAVYMARKPDIYGAQARVQIDLESNPGIDVNGKPMVLNNPSNAPAYFETQQEILKSSNLLRRVVKTLDLEHNRAFFSPRTGQRSTWQRLKEMGGFKSASDDSIPLQTDDDVLMTDAVAPATARDDLTEIRKLAPYVDVIQGGLEVEQVGHTRLVEVRFTHRDPQVAAKVVNAIADTFVLSNLERMTETNAGTGTFLQKRIADLQSQMRNGEERLINYAKNHQIISLDEGQNTVVERLIGLNTQLMSAENERKMAEASYRAALSPGAADALAAGTGGPNNIEAKLGDLRQRLAQLRVEYTDEWAEVKAVQQQIAELEKQAVENRTRSTDVVLKNLETKFREAQARERAIRASFDQQRNETVTQNTAAINYRIIQQEIQTNQQLLNGLLQRFKENDVILAGTPNNIRVADYATTPNGPIGPQRMRGVAMAFAFSLAFGIGFSLLLELSNNTVRTTDDVERRIRLPVVAVVPTVKGGPTRRLLPDAGVLQLRDDNRNLRPLLFYEEPRSPLTEVYRKLRTLVLLSTPEKPPKTVLITSGMPTEGKTTTAVNLALVLAQTGENVLIIDADMRQPTLHNIFELDNTSGLSAILAKEANEVEMLAQVEQHSNSELFVLPAGPIPDNPSELLASPQMRRLLDVMSRSFTHIVIDSPPVITCTDSVLVASMVDSVLLVVRGGKSSHEIVNHTRRELQEVGANIFGVVLNNVDVTPQDNYYYYARPA